MKYFFLVLFSLISGMARACSCIPPGKINEQQYNAYDLILEGTVIKRIDKPEEYTSIIYIKVNRYYKGRLRKKTIKVETPVNDAICGINFKKGEQWLVFARKQDGVYHTRLCSRTVNLGSPWNELQKAQAEDDMRFLEEKLKKGK